LLCQHEISDTTFNAARDRFGMQKTLETTGLVGHYLLVGQILAAFEVDLPEGAKLEIPDLPATLLSDARRLPLKCRPPANRSGALGEISPVWRVPC